MKKLVFSAIFILCQNFAFTLNCYDIQSDPNSYFINMVANSKDDFTYLNSDFNCQNSLLNLDFLKNIYDLSLQIRGDNIDCIGNQAIINEKKFQEKLAVIAVAPKIFENSLNPNENVDLNSFEIWGDKSTKNFMLFNKFKDEYNKQMPNLTQFFEANFDKNYAQKLAKIALDEYVKFAFATHKDTLKMGELEKFIHQDKISADTFREFIYSHEFSEFELTSALNIALLHNKKIDILKILLERGANVNYGDENSIFFAVRSPENLKFLISKGADINYKNGLGLTPIFYAVELKDSELLKFFIYNGAKVNAKLISNTEKMALISNNSYQNLCAFEAPSKTLLMHAAEFGGKEITQMLVKNGANEFSSDDFGLNALDYAILSEDNETIKYLKELGLKETVQKDKLEENEPNDANQTSNSENQ